MICVINFSVKCKANKKIADDTLSPAFLRNTPSISNLEKVSGTSLSFNGSELSKIN